MKSIYTTLFIFFIGMVNAQISSEQPIITKANPSIANLMNFSEVPVNTNTGTPDISVPIASLPTYSKDLNVNVALSYHSSGISFNNKASDVGLGWSLIGEAVISRTIMDMPDEYLIPFWQPRFSNLNRVRFNDVYNYNFMGHTGSFMIYFDAVNNSFSIQNIEYSNLKIEFAMINGTQSINSFVIYDDKGYKYVFDIKDRDTRVCRDMVKTGLMDPNGGPAIILEQAYLT
ncbi:hypothetical protein [Flavobacterium sp.]|uniref:hypothetical protein n=1 Tax=Flavobacterium sp. TaxID=239 RepID=UPI0022C9BF80|nr:hypothetical protein [Flavobacterium sp.]MCZ8090992.1 hypothetical protein [Flavobacterium sp.]